MSPIDSLGLTVGPVTVSALLQRPSAPVALFVLGHGAGAGMSHRFLERISRELDGRGIATLRYQFPYMEAGRSRPDSPPVATAAVRAAVMEAARLAPGVPLFAGGKSFGGRMTSMAAADRPLPAVRGLIFLGFPLHASGRPSMSRADHLREVSMPMLFLQGTRDELADLTLMRLVAESLGQRATLHVVDGADHSFGVLKRSGRTDGQVFAELADTIAAWIGERR